MVLEENISNTNTGLTDDQLLVCVTGNYLHASKNYTRQRLIMHCNMKHEGPLKQSSYMSYCMQQV